MKIGSCNGLGLSFFRNGQFDIKMTPFSRLTGHADGASNQFDQLLG